MLTAQLRRFLLTLVLLNLVFVQITGAVGLIWMLPLLALTLGSPYLWDLQRLLVYRLAWNAALLTIFGLLVLDIRTTGIRFMLEDGLILAAFCQVHVLNNLARQKRPDLVFFNSFLIALVTGFFCQDVVYSLVFVVYAFVLVTGLALAAASSPGAVTGRTLPPAELRQLLRRSCGHAVAVLAITGLLFAFFPRDFDRPGLVDEELVNTATASEVAFSDQIRLDRRTNTKVSQRVVITARLLRGQSSEVPRYWRGATFTLLTRYGWTADTNQQGLVNRTRQVDEPWRPIDGGFVRPNHRPAARLEVLLTDRRAQHLFLPAATNRIQFNCLAWPNIDGNFRLSRNDTGRIRYLLTLNAPGDPLRKMPRTPGPDHVYLHPRRIPEQAVRWNERARQTFPPGADQVTKVRKLREYVQNARDYVLPGEAGAADNLRGFFDGEGGGHCEYFATALTILLRLNDIPCRMVSGYLAQEWDEAGRQLTIRSSHAHAWVEVWDDRTGWYTVDPTPNGAGGDGTGDSLLGLAQDWLRRTWTAVTSFDSRSRDAVLAWSRERLAACLAFARDNPGWAVLLLAGLVALRRLLRARRRQHIDPAVRDYLRVLTRLKLARRPGETPRQLLARVDLPPAHRERLVEATQRHEAARYAHPARSRGRR